MTDKTHILYRAIGLSEMLQILEEEPHQLPETFAYSATICLMLSESHAHKIAQDYKSHDTNTGYAGFVIRFHVDATYLNQLETNTITDSGETFLQIPTEQLSELNRHIVGNIEMVAAYYGDHYEGAPHNFRDFAADGMCNFLYELVLKNKHDFRAEMMLNRRAIYVNYPYWMTRQYDNIPPDRLKLFLQYTADAWRERFPDWHLPMSEKVDSL